MNADFYFDLKIDSSTMLYKPWSSFADQKLWLGYIASSYEIKAINYELPKTFHI